MKVNSKIFLYENDPKKNLDILANFGFSDTSAGTKCTTKAAYRKLPKRPVSPKVLREIAVVASGLALSIAPFGLYLAKSAECFGLAWDGEWTKAEKCWSEQIGAFGKQANTMRYLYFISVVAAIGTAAYAGARWLFQDRNEEERFLMLEPIYSAAANSLTHQYAQAQTEEKKGLVEIARKIIDNRELIHLSLCNVARLSSPQSTLLTEKISRAASSILSTEGLSNKNNVQKRNDS